MEKVRWGLVSTANINRRLIPAIRASERGELTAVASRTLTSAQAYAAKWDIPQAFGSYEAMLDSDEVDAVYISLPNHLHAEWTIYALEHGKHVLCEKPFALTLDEVDAMASASQRTGYRLAEAFMYRHHPQTNIVKEWVVDGRLGDITILRGAFDFAMSDPAINVRMRPEWGGGSLWDVGVYPMSYAQNLMDGPPAWVIGDQWVGASGVDEVFAGQMHFANGVMAQFTCAFRSPFHTFFEIVGTKGRLLLTRPFVGPQEGSVTFYPADGPPQPVAVPDQELYLGEVEDMNTAVLDGAPNFITLAESRDHVRTVLALYESAQQGKAVHLAD